MSSLGRGEGLQRFCLKRGNESNSFSELFFCSAGATLIPQCLAGVWKEDSLQRDD